MTMAKPKAEVKNQVCEKGLKKNKASGISSSAKKSSLI